MATHSAGASIHYEVIDNLTATLTGNWVKDNRASSDQLNAIGDDWDGNEYTVVNAKIAYDLKPFSLYVGVNNLFNKEYSAIGFDGFFGLGEYPAPERNLVAGVKFEKAF